MKTIFKITIAVILLASIFVTINYFVLDTHAADSFRNTFVPSLENIAKMNGSAADLRATNSAKVFNEYSESSIDPLGFYIRVDKVNLFKAVIKDVDPRYKEVYQKSWEYGVSHGKFTSYPDKIGITYIFGEASGDKASAADNNAWFSNLDQLVRGDSVILYYQGTKYTYEVNEIHVVAPTATGYYTGASAVSMVRLQFCGPPTGSLESRTLIDAILVDTEKL